MKRLLEVDRVKLLTIIRNLNAKYEFAHLAQYMMTEILPKFQNYEFLQEMRKMASEPGQPSDLKALLEGTSVYQDKHFKRISRHLRNSFFVDFVVSQMSLQAPEAERVEAVSQTLNKRQKKEESKKTADHLVNLSKKNKQKRRRTSSAEAIA